MEIVVGDKTIHVFTVVSRHADLQTYTESLKRLAQESDRLGFTGMLFFVGNDTPVDPWLAAAQVGADTRKLSPFIALNPVYMHPFSAARAIATLSSFCQRRIFINLIAGTSVAAHEALGETGYDHDRRYARLKEYALCIHSLLTSRRPYTFNGQHYQLKNLQLPLALPEALRPHFYISGHSVAAQEIADALDGERVGMISPQLDNPLGRGGVYLGMVTHANGVHAWREAQRLFPEDAIGQQVVSFSMKFTDAQWKRQLYQQAQDAASASNGYWIAPFKNDRADCPFVVQGHQGMARMVARLIQQGTSSFIIDLPEDISQLAEISRIFELVAEWLNAKASSYPEQTKGDKNDECG
ncbi:LLM class flavin-dependent oxidoreductase [Pectobacteriaceae bacterium CE90]|nr:LLM class flavin-dependent oxidoreductase [Pectobacteriaceae bacterium CE90]